MPSKLSRFTSKVVSLAKRPSVARQTGRYRRVTVGYADWVIVGLHRLRDYLAHPYRRLLDVLHRMPGIAEKSGFSVAEIPDSTTVCTRKQDLEMQI